MSLVCTATVYALQDQAASDGNAANSSAVAAVPRLIKFSGMLKDLTGKPLTGPVDANFAIYKEQADLVPLWSEVQTLQLDEQGRYTVLLGAMQAEGLPMALFTSGEARWLEVAVAGAEPQPRTLLVSVPYALKAGDAETLGGKPASAFMPVSAESGAGQSVTTAVIADTGSRASTLQLTKGGVPTPQAVIEPNLSIPKCLDSKCLTFDSSALYDNAGNIGLGTTTPAARLHVFNGASPGGSVPTTFAILNSGTGTVANRSGWADGNKVAYVGTAGASNYGEFSTYDYGSSQGFNLALNASGGNVGIGTTTPAEKLEVAGNIKATKYYGDGSQLTGISAGTATDLNCANPAGCVSEAELTFDPATQTELNAEATTRATADTNEATVRAAADQARVLKAGDTMTGKLNLPTNGLAVGTNQLAVSSGKVGIGTAAPTVKLDLAGGAGSDSTMAIHRASPDTWGSGLYVYKRGTTGDANAAVVSGTELGYHSFYGWDGSAYGRGAYYIAKTTQAWTNAAHGAQASIATTPNNSTTSLVRLTVDHNGNVGIGTTTPGEKLEVAGNVKASGSVTASSFVGALSGIASDLNCSGCVSASEVAADVATQAELGDEAGLRASADTILQSNINAKVSKAGDTMTGTLNLPTDGLAVSGNQLSLANGNVGIGAAGLSDRELYLYRAGTENATNYGLYVSNGTTQTSGYPTKFGAYVMSSGEVVWDNWGLYVYNQTTNTTRDDAYKYGAQIYSLGTYTGGTGAVTKNWGLYVYASGADTNYPAVFYGGNVGIGTTAPVDTLQVSGDIRVGTGTTGCVKDADATIIAGTCSSDLRLKTNVQPFVPLLDKLVRLRPVHFSWKSAEYPELHFGTSPSFGLIAQEVEEVFPELVTQDPQGWKAVKYSQLPFLMLQGIRELKAENDSLKEQMQNQQAQIEALAAELAEAKQILQVVQTRLLSPQRAVETAGGSTR